jgi:hypothetical protein
MFTLKYFPVNIPLSFSFSHSLTLLFLTFLIFIFFSQMEQDRAAPMDPWEEEHQREAKKRYPEGTFWMYYAERRFDKQDIVDFRAHWVKKIAFYYIQDNNWTSTATLRGYALSIISRVDNGTLRGADPEIDRIFDMFAEAGEQVKKTRKFLDKRELSRKMKRQRLRMATFNAKRAAQTGIPSRTSGHATRPQVPAGRREDTPSTFLVRRQHASSSGTTAGPSSAAASSMTPSGYIATPAAPTHQQESSWEPPDDPDFWTRPLD